MSRTFIKLVQGRQLRGDVQNFALFVLEENVMNSVLKSSRFVTIVEG